MLEFSRNNTTSSFEQKGVKIKVIDEVFSHLKDIEFIILWTSTKVNSKGEVKTFYHIAQPDTMFSIFGIAEYYFGESQVEIIKE